MPKYTKRMFNSIKEFNQDASNYEDNHQKESLDESYKILVENGIEIINICKILKNHELDRDDQAYFLRILVIYLDIKIIKKRWIKKSNSSQKNMLLTQIAFQYKNSFMFLFYKFVEINSNKIVDKERLLKEVQTAVDNIPQTKMMGANTQTNPLFTDETYSYFDKMPNVCPEEYTESICSSSNYDLFQSDEFENPFQISTDDSFLETTEKNMSFDEFELFKYHINDSYK